MLTISFNKTQRKTWQVLSLVPENYTNMVKTMQVEMFVPMSDASFISVCSYL